MSYSASDLRPVNPTLSIGGRYFTISLLTLQIAEIIKENFCEINVIYQTIEKNPLLMFDIIWLLIINKGDFKNVNDFKNFLYAQAKTSEVSALVKAALDESIVKSMPKIKNSAKFEELLKIAQAQDNASGAVCYGVYYDRLAKRYGYTIDDFFNLTLGQLHLLLTVSTDQHYEEIEVQANLQGKKLKQRMKYEDIEEKVDKKMDDEAAQLFDRLKKEYEVKNVK